ncbi:UNVERIFIED_CONTAM: CRP/FNR family transcriptional regulator [Acetivibrio alkalicellulosi]
MIIKMENLLGQCLNFWNDLSREERDNILRMAFIKKLKKGTRLSHDNNECSGLEIINKGVGRVYITSPNGGEITLYRLLEGDVCILSAACMIKSLHIEVQMELLEDTELLIIPKNTFKNIIDSNHKAKNYVLELVSDRFSEVMVVLNNLVFSSTGRRLADILLERSKLIESSIITATHDSIAKDLGTAREVVSRLLKQFQIDGIVKLSRGTIEIIDQQKLRKI